MDAAADTAARQAGRDAARAARSLLIVAMPYGLAVRFVVSALSV